MTHGAPLDDAPRSPMRRSVTASTRTTFDAMSSEILVNRRETGVSRLVEVVLKLRHLPP